MGEISISSEAAMLLVLPAAGQVKMFINTDKNNILYYVNSDGQFFVYNANDASSLEECCSCIIAKQWMDRITCALNSGMITATEFGTFINSGLTVISTETIDAETGTKTCRVDIGPKTDIPVVSVAIDGRIPEKIIVGDTLQLTAIVLPATAPQGIIWISSNPLKAVVSSSGLVLAVSSGTVGIFAYSASDGSKFDVLNLTIS